MEALLTDMLNNEEYAAALLDIAVTRSARRLALAAKLAGMGVDIILMADDFCTQLDLMMSLPMWASLVQGVTGYRHPGSRRQTKPDILVLFHSDGAVDDSSPT